jgi:4-diphosphocytidyl-2-C-methyl-D-erythritol kinase
MAARGVARIAPAKINLALHVTGRRADGYHLIDSIAVFADVGDRVEILPADKLKLSLSGPFAAHAPGDPGDLAWRAAQEFFQWSGVPTGAAIRVAKNIPAGAGLGGGSADAAAALLGLDELFGTKLPAHQLRAVGLKLGADVPMCLVGRALRARGIGEEISPLEGFPPLPMVLVWPGKPVSTAEVFKALARRDNPPLPDPPREKSPVEIAGWLQSCRNDLEPAATKILPEIGAVLDALRGTDGCLLARMSGSGSACFGLFADQAATRAAAAAVAKARPDWWSVATEAR